MPQLRALGSFEMVGDDGRPVGLGPRRQQTVLAALLVDAGRPVPLDAVVDRVWAEHPPAAVRSAVHTYVNRLRNVLRLGGASFQIEHGPPGYVLRAATEQVDLWNFRRLTTDGRPASLQAALALWRGIPFTGLPGPWLESVRSELVRARIEAVIDLARAESPAEMLSPLRALATEHPMVEPLAAALMRALVATGRPAEAADHYARTRAYLSSELGVEPSEELRREHLAVLRTKPAKSVPPSSLPLDVQGFVGRADALDALDSLVTPGRRSVAVVSGTAGVGKTALAVRWAHRIRDRFADGHVFVDLRGFDTSRPPVSPEQAVHNVLSVLGVPVEDRPTAFDALVAFYRRTLAHRTVLLILDNARDAEQIRPLLPGSPGSRTLVTSRNQLDGLIATQGAQPVLLASLTTAEARDLLVFRLGRQRTTTADDALTRVVASCGGLPLALVVTAARTALRPVLGLAELADELESSAGGLDAFRSDDPVADLRSVFGCSYRSLSPETARLFRTLGACPGTHASVQSAASGAGVPPVVAARLLDELRRGHLVTETEPNRYVCHDLLKAYAVELHLEIDTATDRAEVTRRLMDHHVRSAYRAAGLLQPWRDPVPLPEPDDQVTVAVMNSPDEARAWFAAEREAVLGCVDIAARANLDRELRALAWSLRVLLHMTTGLRDLVTVNEKALVAARRLGDRKAIADAAYGLALVHAQTGQLQAATDAYEQALHWYRDLSETASEAHVLGNLARILEQQNRYAEALSHAERALELYRVAGHPQWEARAVSSVAWFRIAMGEYDRSLLESGRALSLLRRLGDHEGEAAAWDTRAQAYRRRGDHDEAERCHQKALVLHRRRGEVYAGCGGARWPHQGG